MSATSDLMCFVKMSENLEEQIKEQDKIIMLLTTP